MSSSTPVLTAETALQNHPIGSHGRPWALYELGRALQIRFSTEHSWEDLELAKTYYSEAIENEVDLAKQARYLNNLGIIYQYKHNETGEDNDLGEFLKCAEKATEHVSDDLRPAILQNYAIALQRRFERYGNTEDLNECIDIYREALSLPTASKPKLYSNLCGALTTRFQLGKVQSDLEEACEVGNQAVSLTDDQTPMRAIFLDTYANALCARYLTTNSAFDLDESIKHSEAAVSIADQQGLPELPGFCVNLGSSLATRYKLHRTRADLDSAIEILDIAEETINQNNPSYEMLLTTKGNTLRMKFEETAAEVDLDLAFDTCTQAISLPMRTADLRAQSETALGCVLLRKYEFTGSPDILDEAVWMHKQAIQRIVNDASSVEIWHNLGTTLQARFELRGSLEDLNEALEAMETSLRHSSERSSGYASSLHGLGNVLVRIFERMDLSDALDRAVSVYKEALDMTLDNDRSYTGRLTCYGLALQIRYELAGSISDFEDAVKYCQASVETSHKESNYYLCLVNLGNCFLRRVVRESSDNDVEYLQQAIKNLQAGADEMPEFFSVKAMCLNNLGKAYELLFEQTQRFDEYNQATKNYKKAMILESAPPMLRVMAGYRGMVLTWSKNPSKAIMFLKGATSLLPIISPRLLNRADQQDNIATFSGLASVGASILLESGDECFEALQILELSRGIMNSLLIETRIDTEDLEKEDPVLAEEFKDLRDQLESSPTSLSGTSGLVDSQKLDMERRIKASKRLNEIIEKIRSNDKTNLMFLGPSMEETQSLAGQGTIVVLNVSSIRSDALIITRNKIWNYQLLDLDQASVLQQARNYMGAIDKDTPITRKKTNKALHVVFKWLWDAIIGPVLSELDLVAMPTQDWPRVCWIPIGLMSIFPFHAAGEHSGKTDANALDRVISSYATTIRSLSQSQKANKIPLPSTSTKAVFVAMSTTPAEVNLSFADSEVTKLISNISTYPTSTIMRLVFRSPAYKQEVLLALQDCTIAHFSCHGIIDHSDPSKSSLLLSDWQTNPLTVADITALQLRNAQLAYLSACHASGNRVLDLLDEGIHLTGAFQMAGFRQAVGSLWQVDDERSGLVAEMVWDGILKGDGELDFGKVSEGLHFAVRELRERSRWVEGVEMRFSDQPIVWAPFIHMGI